MSRVYCTQLVFTALIICVHIDVNNVMISKLLHNLDSFVSIVVVLHLLLEMYRFIYLYYKLFTITIEIIFLAKYKSTYQRHLDSTESFKMIPKQ